MIQRGFRVEGGRGGGGESKNRMNEMKGDDWSWIKYFKKIDALIGDWRAYYHTNRLAG